MSSKGVSTQTEIEKEIQLPPFKQNKGFYLSCSLVLCLWVLFCWQGLRTVVEIWYGNEIFNHGFFIVPGALYLIYLKRHELLAQPIYTTPLAFIVIIPAILLYVVGVAGDIQLFMHAATFTLLPALIWLMIGTKAAKTILFPLVFMLFSIPVGEQLIPYLQEIAADGSVALLQLTGVPLYRSGLYIEIPQGRFLVAEACSGVSFFIASFVIGSLYAYLNLASAKRRATFVAISLIFPVLANIVRVYGIILIAYWTDMEHAAGADHLIYGWFFFAFVIVCLLGIGELMRQPISNTHAEQSTARVSLKSRTTPAICAFFVLTLSIAWLDIIQNASQNVDSEASVDLTGIREDDCSAVPWRPLIKSPENEQHIFIKNVNCNAQLFTAWFSEKDNELVSSLHRIFDPDKYSLDRVQKLIVNEQRFTVYSVVSTSGKRLSIVKWYTLDQSLITSDIFVKIYQIKNVLTGERSGGRMWVLAIDGHEQAATESVLLDLSHKLGFQ